MLIEKPGCNLWFSPGRTQLSSIILRNSKHLMYMKTAKSSFKDVSRYILPIPQYGSAGTTCWLIHILVLNLSSIHSLSNIIYISSMKLAIPVCMLHTSVENQLYIVILVLDPHHPCPHAPHRCS